MTNLSQAVETRRRLAEPAPLDIVSSARGRAPQTGNDPEAQLVELKRLVVSMRETLEQAQASAAAEAQATREFYEAEIKQLKTAVIAGRDTLEVFREGSSDETARAVSTVQAEAAQLRETIQAMRAAASEQAAAAGLFAMTLPASLLGAMVGVNLYRSLSDINFRRAVLILLAISGFSLLAKAIV
jgi:hypothetical protein